MARIEGKQESINMVGISSEERGRGVHSEEEGTRSERGCHGTVLSKAVVVGSDAVVPKL